MDNQQQDMNLTPEELAVRKEEMLKFYTDSLPYLEAQFKYEELLMKLDEVRFKRTSIQVQYAMMMQGPESEEEGEEELPENLEKPHQEPLNRKLKKS
jgi:hypothetical protein